MELKWPKLSVDKSSFLRLLFIIKYKTFCFTYSNLHRQNIYNIFYTVQNFVCEWREWLIFLTRWYNRKL